MPILLFFGGVNSFLPFHFHSKVPFGFQLLFEVEVFQKIIEMEVFVVGIKIDLLEERDRKTILYIFGEDDSCVFFNFFKKCKN